MTKAAKKAGKKAAVKKARYTRRGIKPQRAPSKPAKKVGFEALPIKQQYFVTAFEANGFNATQAAITAGYAPKNADTQGSRLMANAAIKAVLDERKATKFARREMTAQRVLDEIDKIATFDPRRMFRPDGTLVPIHELDDDTAAAVAGLDVTEIAGGGKGKNKRPFAVLKKIKIADKLRALELRGRHFKLFTDRVEHTGEVKITRVVIPAKPAPPAKN